MKLSQKEIKYGILYMAISLLVLPGILGLLPLRAGQVNFAYFCINFGAVAVIFRRFLLGELAIALDRPFPTIYYAILYSCKITFPHQGKTVSFESLPDWAML